MNKKIFLFCFFILFFLSILFSAIVQYGIKVYSVVDKTNIGIDEQVTLRLTIAGSGFFPDPKLPNIKDFNIVKVSQFTGSDFSSGKPVPYTVFEYMLTPFHKGNFFIPKIYVQYKGFLYSSEEYKISVGDKVRNIRLEGSNFKETSPIARNISSDPIFIKSSISKNNVFYNQQIIYTYTIFTRVPIRNIPKIQIPEFEGFRYENLYYRKEYVTKINNVLYKAFEFKFALFPYMTNTQKISPIKMICDKNIFINQSEVSNYLKGSSYFVRNSESFNVEVSQIPIDGKPLNFGGLIGNFDIVSEVEENEIDMDGMIILTIKIKGTGNITSVPTIKCPLIDKLREYDSDTFVNFDKKEDKIVGEKIFKFALIPVEKGEDIIPSIGFSYFDENQGKYLTKYTKPINIKIVKHKKDNLNENKENKNKKNNAFYYIGIGVIILFSIIFFLIKKRNKK
jgi:hypothetical protein